MAEERMLNDEILLGLIKANSGGGGGGTTDYDDLNNKPQIGGVTLSGNKSASDLGLATTTDLAGKQDTLTFDSVPTDGSTNPVESNGVYDALALKQDKTDNTLQTTDKTVAGAVNELKSGLTNLDNEVNGDATVYPYADVITIPDAIPANVADCTVKIEPVQDLHGYDKPWVGGAGRNKVTPLKSVTTTYGVVCTLLDGSDGQMTISGQNSENAVDAAILSYMERSITLKANHVYRLRGNWQNLVPSEATMRIDLRTSIIANIIMRETDDSYTPTEDIECHLCIRIASNYVVPNGVTLSPCLTEDNTDTSYAPYTNICPITGHTEASVQRDGKNLFNKDAAGINKNHAILPTGYDYPTDNYNISDYIAVKGGIKYVLNGTGGPVVVYYDDTKTYISGEILSNTKTFTTPDNAVYIRFDYKIAEQDIMQLEVGEVSTSYVSYVAPQTYTIALGDTIYGGTVDFDSGVMTVTHQYVTKNTSTMNNLEQYPGWIGAGIKQIVGAGIDGVISTCVNVSDVIRANTLTVNDILFFEKNDIGLTQTELIALAIDVAFVVELTTPTTIQLTPTQIQLLKGTNTLTASTGQISVTVNGVSGAIGSLQEQVNGLTRAIGWDDARNIFNGLIRQGYVYSTTGEYVGDAMRWVCTTKQECKENTTYTVSASSSFLTRKIIVIYFDSNDTIISYSAFDHEASPVNINATITTPDNTAYIIVDIANQRNVDGYNITPSDVWDVQIEEGTQVTPYIPYHPVIGTAVEELLDKVPDAPSTDGTYSLQVTVASGVPTYSWVSNA